MYENLNLKDWCKAPPGGWFYFQPVTELRIQARDSIDLLRQIQEHRQYKKLDRCSSKEVREDVERQIIERISGNEHYCTNKQVNHVVRQ